MFEINSTTGEITTNASLDRETKSQYILTVRAEDSKYKYYTLSILPEPL